eukprot:gene35481-43011_t
MTSRLLNIGHKGVSLTCEEDLLATWEEIEEISENENNCFALYDDGSQPWKIATMSTVSNYAASLCPPLDKPGAPTLLLGGKTMHRISGDDMNPTVDTRNKLASVRISSSSRVLDTCMGLGYTAIGAARLIHGKGDGNGPKAAGYVHTFEVDTASLEMSAYNPHSQALFDQSLPLTIAHGDVTKMLLTTPSESYDVIIHDPPA